MQITVEAQKRETGSKPNALRRSGQVPANVYGHNGTESIQFTINAKTVEKLLQTATINNTIVDLNIADTWQGQTLLREVQTHPWKNFPYHLSFYAVSAQQTLEITVPLQFVGEAPGVKLEGGILDPVLTELQVACTSGSIPNMIEVDVSKLVLGNALHIDELALPEGVKALAEARQVVVSVLPPAASEAGDTEE